MVHIPTERNQEFIDEILADLGFLVGGGKKMRLIRLEIPRKRLNQSKRILKRVRHGGRVADEGGEAQGNGPSRTGDSIKKVK